MTPLERAVDSCNAVACEGPMDWAAIKCRALAFSIIATMEDDPHATLARMQTLAAQIDGIAENAMEAARRPQ